MSATCDQPIPQRALGGATLLAPLLLSLATLALAVPWQTRWGVIPDTSWIITLCERVLGGERLYVDVVETNPPFTVWLYLPAVYLAGRLGLSPEHAVHAYVYLMVVAGLGFAAFVARSARLVENPGLYAMLPAFLALLVLFPGNSFSEREHLGTALLLPLLVLTAWRASEDRSARPGAWLAMAAGLSGSVIVLVKPYYALLILAPALWMAWRQRSIRLLFAVEYWTVGLVCSAYLAGVLWLHPEFFSDLYPVLADTYMEAKWHLRTIAIYSGPYLIALVVLRLLRPGLRLSPLVIVLLAASLAALVPLVYQGKGWPYHAYPAVSLALMALLCRLAQPAGGAGRGAGLPKALVALAIAANALPYLVTQKPAPDFVASIRAATDRPSVGAVGSGIEAGHPLVRMLDGRWISAYCSDWLGGLATMLAIREGEDGRTVDAQRHEGIASTYLDFKVRELVTARPALILVQKGDVVWSRLVMERDAISRLMQEYRFLAEDGVVAVYVRDGASEPPQD